MKRIELRESGLAADLTEDLATRWVPDALADIDLAEAIRRPRVDREDVRITSVPRPHGGNRRAPVLSGSALSALRRAVEPLRKVSNDVLDPAVCGYRTGASGTTAYSDEYRRFRAFSEAMCDQASWVIVADVNNFFDSVSLDAVRLALRDEFEPSADPILELLPQLHSRGVAGLPAGYGDARLVANAILHPVDQALGTPFTRWVDDYRVFASTRAHAEDVVQRLNTELGNVGLQLNKLKLEILPVSRYLKSRHGVPLDSVYHPQDEPRETVRASLRSVFIDAISTGDRRQLRFALPRLADELDPIAIEYALVALRGNSIEAPRLAQYLQSFTNDADVCMGLRHLANDPRITDWVLMRIVPLLCQINLDFATLEGIRLRAQATSSSLLWGLLVRLLAIHRHPKTFRLVSDPEGVRDQRAAIAALIDIDADVPDSLLSPTTEPTVYALGLTQGNNTQKVPMPSAESLL